VLKPLQDMGAITKRPPSEPSSAKARSRQGHRALVVLATENHQPPMDAFEETFAKTREMQANVCTNYGGVDLPAGAISNVPAAPSYVKRAFWSALRPRIP
jgi:hypothetical protein